MTSDRSNDARFYGFTALALIAFPLLFPLVHGYSGLATQILIVAIAASGLNVLLGFAGQLSYGNAAFYGLGSYAASLTVLTFFPHVQSMALAIAIGVLTATVAALAIGTLVVRLSGIYFALITVAFAQMVFFIVFQWRSLTHGDDGLQGVAAPLLNLGFARLDLTQTLLPAYDVAALGDFGHFGDIKFWYVYVAIITFAVLSFVRILVRSQFGEVLAAIRENENRAMYIGFDPRRYKLAAFVIAGALCGLAGALNGLYSGSVAPDALGVEQSGNLVIYTVIGGVQTIVGPVIGTALLLWLQGVVGAVTPAWRLIEGILFVAVIVVLPGGISSLVSGRRFSFARLLRTKS